MDVATSGRLEHVLPNQSCHFDQGTLGVRSWDGRKEFIVVVVWVHFQ